MKNLDHVLESLTEEESRVFWELIGSPKIAKEIAHTLNMSKYTVDTRSKSIYKKIGVTDRIALLMWSYKQGLEIGRNWNGD